MNSRGPDVLTSQEDVGLHAVRRPAKGVAQGVAQRVRRRGRGAALASLLLGLALAAAVPVLNEAAGYVAVLAAVVAASSLAAGLRLWRGPALVAWAVAVAAAATVVVVEVLGLVLGLPGTSGPPPVRDPAGLVVLGQALAVLVLTGVDRLRHRPEPLSDHPYAL